MEQVRLLLVDDEPGIRTTLAAILKMHGFDVTAHATVPDALTAIQQEKFDVLLTDLNVGEPADGFTLVSAMRRTQPQAVNLIITGYPAFETALHAIRNQVDDYMVKPTDPEELIKRIRERLANRERHDTPPLRRVSYIVTDNQEKILKRFVEEIYNSGAFPVKQLNRDQLRNHFPAVLTDLVAELQNRPVQHGIADKSAMQHGKIRYTQGFSLPLMVEEFGILRSTIFEVIQENLLAVDVSSLIHDLSRIGQELDKGLEQAILGFQQCYASEQQSRTA